MTDRALLKNYGRLNTSIVQAAEAALEDAYQDQKGAFASADWNQEEDIYDGVVMAAFGGLRIFMPNHFNSDKAGGRGSSLSNEPSNEPAEDDAEMAKNTMKIHPAAVLPFVGLLFFIQSTVLLAMMFDSSPFTNVEAIDIVPGLRKFEGEEEDWLRQPTRMHMVLVVKCMMLFTLQVQSLGEFLNALKPLGLVLNVYNWYDFKHWGYSTRGTMGKGKLANAAFLFGICAIAKCMQLIVCYLACVVSLNVILTARDVQEVIFNGLVPLFITDLDNSAFTFLSAVLHVDLQYYRRFKLRQASQRRDEGADQGASSGAGASGPEETRGFLEDGTQPARDESGGCLRIFRALRGGPTGCLIFMFLIYFYSRQLFVTLHALETGVVPGARDICMMYRSAHHAHPNGQSEGLTQQVAIAVDGISYEMLSVLMRVVHIDLYDVLQAIGSRTNDDGQSFAEICLGEEHLERMQADEDVAFSDFARLSWTDIWPLYSQHWLKVTCVMFVMFVLLGVPQAMVLWWTHFRQPPTKADDLD
mmetsp:Transcript_64318/g.119551  ORF Transcript_64318/g.119551 Transcript_64318/m.119551 type:complete len:529 (+) Transcript_64318:64-1650(+)